MTTQLAITGGHPLGVGDPMPIGNLTDMNDDPVSLDATRSGRAAVIVFYGGGWCPYCNATLQAYERELIPKVRSRGAAFFAISPDVPDGSLTLHDLTYDVFSDQQNTISRQLGILPDARTPGCLAAESVQHGDVPPLPTTLIVDTAGVIRWMDINPDHDSRTEPSDVLAALDSITQRAHSTLGRPGLGHTSSLSGTP